MKQMYTFILFGFFASCASTSKAVSSLDYLGTSFSPTDSVRVFVDASAIEKPYTIIGKGYVKSVLYNNVSVRRIQTDAVENAKKNGADAVLIQDYYTPAMATGYNTLLRTDSIGKGTLSIGNTTVNQTSTQRFTIVFLKYK